MMLLPDLRRHDLFQSFFPPLTGVHRQVLGATVGWFIGYHLTKYANYKWAKRDQEMLAYMKFHPEDFQKKGNSGRQHRMSHYGQYSTNVR